jgi:hypothetical protein
MGAVTPLRTDPAAGGYPPSPSRTVHATKIAERDSSGALVGITLGTYSHVAEGMQADAAALVARDDDDLRYQSVTRCGRNPLAIR